MKPQNILKVIGFSLLAVPWIIIQFNLDFLAPINGFIWLAGGVAGCIGYSWSAAEKFKNKLYPKGVQDACVVLVFIMATLIGQAFVSDDKPSPRKNVSPESVDRDLESKMHSNLERSVKSVILKQLNETDPTATIDSIKLDFVDKNKYKGIIKATIVGEKVSNPINVIVDGEDIHWQIEEN
jgi:thiol:disulfide interchange protein